ncbi:ferritin-like domain-containing protein [Nostoc sp. CHAB 5784]|uniref:ferritin-like domain-containing protein n=1 Tax=Nostoc mirabile TaxID=2907820 RepID=UPI001E41238E|nr:ferritin-like domain-containing protein [Nostoc mirabile]MCC5665757.1 ferritin-like domain-containing protein [Nostoc mirabile CHAB5784]
MKLGSVEHKELFCQSFMESYREYEPENFPWPDLDDTALTLLRSIPFWDKALDTERQAGAIVSGYAATVNDPILQNAIALQGKEESRHARLLQTLIDRYGIELPERQPIEVPQNIEPVFTRFGFEECLDTFFAYGLFAIAREANVFPESIFTIFDPIIDEETRHIVFFVNWFTYTQIHRGQEFTPLRSVKTLWHYGKALSNLIAVFGNDDPSKTGFAVTGTDIFTKDLTIEKFLSICLSENQRRMSKYDPRLLQPQLLPRLASIALRILELIPKRKLETVERASA